MRSLADRYRDHFPALILGSARVGGKHRHAWTEVAPGGGPDSYSIQPGARAGTVSQNYALEENNHAAPAGSLVWMRHRDESDGTLHYAFLYCCSDASLDLPDEDDQPSGSGSGDGTLPSRLCLTVADSGNCAALAGTYELVYSEPYGGWLHAGDVMKVDFRARAGGGWTITFGLVGGGTLGENSYDVDAVPWTLADVSVTGPCDGAVDLSLTSGPCGDCTYRIDGAGKICVGCDVTFDFCNTTPLPVATAICPVFSDLVAGEGISIVQTPGAITITAVPGPGSGSARVLTGLIVQRQTVGVPAGITVGAPECRLDAQDCCDSGDVEGCCWPRPPDLLYAHRLAATAGCSCLLRCVILLYDADRDAWYSTAFVDVLCDDQHLKLRLKCYRGAYRLDVVGTIAEPGGQDEVILEGAPAMIAPSCDPFLAAWEFSDPTPLACATDGTFSYLLAEVSCDDDDQSGSGDGPTAPCDDFSATTDILTVTNKAGDCDCLPDEMIYSGPQAGHDAAWSTNTCPGNVSWYLDCVDGFYQMSESSGAATFTLVSFQASPLVMVWDVVVPVGAGTCTPGGGSARLTITSSDD